MNSTLLNDIQTGCLAGLVATCPMTLAMTEMHRHLPLTQRYRLPPRQITMNFATKIGAKHRLSARERLLATIAAHFAVGGSAGAIYGPLARHSPFPPVVSGALFGLAVWSGNYLGILPSLGLLSSATKHPAKRNALMIAAHLVWGATTGILVARLQRETKQRLQRRRTQAPISVAAQWDDRLSNASPLPHNVDDVLADPMVEEPKPPL